MPLHSAFPKIPESHEAHAARLEARLERIAPGGRLVGPDGVSLPLGDLTEARQTTSSAFESMADPIARAATERVVASGITTIRHVAEGGGRLADLPPRELTAIEAVIDAIRRVSWYVENGDYVVRIRAIDDGLDDFWRKTFESARNQVCTVCASVAAIIVDGQPVGTGWLVAKDTLITNAHVAPHLCYRQDGLPASDRRDRWRLESGRDIVAAFRFEHGNMTRTAEHMNVPITDVCHVETSRTPDIAVFRLGAPPCSEMPKPLGLDLDVNPLVGRPDTKVYTVGHPIMDLQDDAANVALSFGGPVDGTKRFSPGTIIENLDAETLAHDCSTTNGSSGSPLVALGSAKPMALHYFGRPGVRNEAVLFSAYATHPAIKAALTGDWSST